MDRLQYLLCRGVGSKRRPTMVRVQCTADGQTLTLERMTMAHPASCLLTASSNRVSTNNNAQRLSALFLFAPKQRARLVSLDLHCCNLFARSLSPLSLSLFLFLDSTFNNARNRTRTSRRRTQSLAQGSPDWVLRTPELQGRRKLRHYGLGSGDSWKRRDWLGRRCIQSPYGIFRWISESSSQVWVFAGKDLF